MADETQLRNPELPPLAFALFTFPSPPIFIFTVTVPLPPCLLPHDVNLPRTFPIPLLTSELVSFSGKLELEGLASDRFGITLVRIGRGVRFRSFCCGFR